MASERTNEGAALEEWFDLDGDNGLPSSEADVTFLAALRARAVSHRWPYDWVDTYANHTYLNGDYVLTAGMLLCDAEKSRGLITFALFFDGKRIIGDQVHDQIHDFMYDIRGPTEAAMEFSGTLEALVARAVEWFEWLLTWPIERREWFEDGTLVYREWVLSRTNRKLWVNASYPPPRPPDRVVLVCGTRDR